MKNIVLSAFLAFVVLQPACGATASPMDAACEKATRAIGKFVAPAKHPDEYYCRLNAQSAHYFIFRIGSNYPAPEGAGSDWVGSDLMGFFAVSKASGKVYEWNIGESTLGPALRARAPASSRNHHRLSFQ